MQNDSIASDEPIVFVPLFMERVWGGRRLEEVFGKSLPAGVAIGESWELCDRPEAQSRVAQGTHQGKTLHDLWSLHRGLFGEDAPDSERFPLLVKILDAREKLSIQVHPPASVAALLNGEPKTEMWYIADADPNADLYVGLRHGISRHMFEQALGEGRIETMIHRIPVISGDSMFLPSGRLHAIGAGNLIFEIQQNSDTTYRVFDWNRKGLDGSPRELHIKQSMQSIDFDDFEPALSSPGVEGLLASCDYFNVQEWELCDPRLAHAGNTCAIIAVIHGQVSCASQTFRAGDFFLVPATMRTPLLSPAGHAHPKVLRTVFPNRTANMSKM